MHTFLNMACVLPPLLPLLLLPSLFHHATALTLRAA
jgi:hypothetical protein